MRRKRARGGAAALSPLPVLALLLAGAGACGGTGGDAREAAAPERVMLPPGASFSQVADSLAAHHIISNRFWFKLLARLRGVDRSVRAGMYEFPPGASSWAVLGHLATGQVAALRFTVPEGLTLYDVAALAETRLGVPADSFEAAATDSAAASAILGFPAPSFEGFLQPETYLVPPSTAARELVRLMAEQFVHGWDRAWNARLDSLHMTPFQLITFASIVEGEARADDERETIAGVYRNRLQIGMALQADPTVQYAIERQTGRRKPRLYEKDYQLPSPYNTYLNPGLPPGPVNSPSRRSIEASLAPAPVPYLYFVAGPDGRHIFSRTYPEHLRAVARVRREERRRGS